VCNILLLVRSRRHNLSTHQRQRLLLQLQRTLPNTSEKAAAPTANDATPITSKNSNADQTALKDKSGVANAVSSILRDYYCMIMMGMGKASIPKNGIDFCSSNITKVASGK
jgi:hypothetical protein